METTNNDVGQLYQSSIKSSSSSNKRVSRKRRELWNKLLVKKIAVITLGRNRLFIIICGTRSYTKPDCKHKMLICLNCKKVNLLKKEC